MGTGAGAAVEHVGATTRGSLVVVTGLAALLVVADLGTKSIADAVGRVGPISPRPNDALFLDVEGLSGPALAIVATILAVGVGWFAVREHLKGGCGPLPPALVIAGLVGNAADRIVLGHVRDWFRIGGIVFNLADLFILAGLVLVIVAASRRILDDKGGGGT